MSNSCKSIPSPSMIVALIALFVALGGTAAALNGSNTVFSDDITNDEVHSADVRNDTLTGGGLSAADLLAGSVGPSEANGLTGADIQNGTLGAGDLAPTTRHVVAPQGPNCIANPGTFCSGWVNSDAPAEGTSFFKDLSGIVHIQGMIRCTCAATDEIFYLPVGYRPAGQLGFAVDVSGFEHGRVDVRSDGSVRWLSGAVTGHLSLSGISFLPSS